MTKVELDGLEKNILARAELTKMEVTQIIELLKRNRKEFICSPNRHASLDPTVAFYKLNIDSNTKKIVQKKRMKRQKVITEEVKEIK